MGGLSIWHIMIVAILFILLFGRGKISDVMGDVAKGIKSFKKGLADDDDRRPAELAEPRAIPKSEESAESRARSGDKNDVKNTD